MNRDLPKSVRAFNDYVVEHPVASWLMWSLGMLIVIPSIRWVLEGEPERFGILSWVSIAAFVTTPLSFTFGFSKLSARDALAVRWLIAQVTWIWPWVGVVAASPQWLISIGLAETIVLMALGLRGARRETSGGEGGLAARS